MITAWRTPAATVLALILGCGLSACDPLSSANQLSGGSSAGAALTPTPATPGSPQAEPTSAGDSPSATSTAAPLDISRWTQQNISAPAGIPRYSLEVVQTLPSRPDAFIQGLEVVGDELLVSTGLYGKSVVYRTPLDDPSQVLQESASLADSYFGEGITQVGDKIWQLTWQSGQAISRDAASLQELGRTTYSGEGWGLCHLPSGQLAMSDGTHQIRFLEPDSFVERGRVNVLLGGQPLDSLNELDCAVDPATGQPVIYANRWFSSDIYRIDPATGQVTGIIDAAPLFQLLSPAPNDANAVLNGIASIPGTDELLVGGKLWPQLFRVRLQPQAS